MTDNRQNTCQSLHGGRVGEGFTLSSLSIGYHVKGGLKTVAANINAVVPEGKLTCLIGSNGIGKSTLIKTLAAFQPPLAGNIYIKGENLNEYSPENLARIISVVLTDRPDTINLTVREVVSLGRMPYTGFWGTLSAADKTVVEDSMKQTGVAALAGRMIDTLSDGERQKVMIAKALAQQTPVIILDEPTAFLDYPSKVETMLLLMRLSRETGKTILMSAHDLELVLQTADVIWLMSRDGILYTGTPRELADGGVLSAFIDRPEIKFDRATMRIGITGKR